MHYLKRQVEPGYGSWMFCHACGATQHSGFWWFAGMKSKIEPPCDNDRHGQNNWLKIAHNDIEEGFSGGVGGGHD